MPSLIKVTTAQVKSKADLTVLTLPANIALFQATWLAAHGKYWQGVITPMPIPSDGSDVAPDKDAKCDDSENVAWKDTGIVLPLTVPCSVEVFAHSDGTNQGYSVI